MRKTVLLFLFLALYSPFCQGQSDDLYYIDNRGRDARLAPRVGLGAGVFTFFGDVKDDNYNHVFTSTFGAQFLASANLSRYFDLDLNIIYGKIGINERAERNINFRSELFVGSVGVSYNFNHLYRKPGIIQPFIGFGVAFINFDSKTDIFDAAGNRYHYWSDGSIRLLAENDPAADLESTPIIQRDYVYETDLRDENLDGLGKYDQFTFSLPVTAGIDFKMGKRVSAKLSAGFYYTFTDLIDDISDAGEGNREGNSQNDMFLFTSASVSYSIGVGRTSTKSAKTEYFEDMDFYALYMADTDADGVNDFDDRCALTPHGVAVDEHGCAIDSDLDVIANYRDKEDPTPPGNVVNLDGVTLTDSMMLASYDSIAVERARMHEIYPSGILDRNPPLSAEDSAKLAIMMMGIQNNIEQESEFAKLFDEISRELFSQGPESAGSVEDVYKRADRVYKEMVRSKELSPTLPLVITREENINTTIPPEFKDADYNTDGIITAQEVMRVIEDVLEGISPLNASQLFNLIDFYHEYMEDAETIDFGGTMAVFMNGTLNILENYKSDGLNDTQRFLVNKFKEVDFNGDGQLTPDEVNRMIDLFQKGQSSYSEEMIYELIDLFFED